MAGGNNDLSEDGGLIYSINITPFVDVVLVLLIIFIVTAPMLVKDILEIRLPKVNSGDGQVLKTLGVVLNRDGQILINGELINEESLSLWVKAEMKKTPESQAIISADVDLSYGKVVRVIDILKTSGLEKFAVEIVKQDSAATAEPRQGFKKNQ